MRWSDSLAVAFALLAACAPHTSGSESAAVVHIPAEPVASSELVAESAPARFEMRDLGPLFEWVAATGDGIWHSVPDPRRPKAPVAIEATKLHPDPRRPFATLSVIAVDLRQLELHLVAGAHEPRATTAAGRAYRRRALIPRGHHAALVAAFNGGSRAGDEPWGMHVDNTTLVSAHPQACNLFKRRDGAIELAPVHDPAADVVWWLQTPRCTYKDDKNGVRWVSNDPVGTLHGDTVIRRSAVGLSSGRDVLFVGLGEALTARTIAQGMHHAGCDSVAPLDVNFAFPRIVTFESGTAGVPVAKLFEGAELTEGAYITRPSLRDFFYLARRQASSSRDGGDGKRSKP